MSTVKVVLTDGSSYNFDVKQLFPSQVFQMVQTGQMTFEPFEEWRLECAQVNYHHGYEMGQIDMNVYEMNCHD